MMTTSAHVTVTKDPVATPTAFTDSATPHLKSCCTVGLSKSATFAFGSDADVRTAWLTPAPPVEQSIITSHVS